MPLLKEKVISEILTQTSMDNAKKESVSLSMKGDEEMGNNVTAKKKKLITERIPAFGLFMALLSVFCFSLASVIVKVLTDLNSIEILVIRCIVQLMFYGSTTLIRGYPFFGERGHRIDLALRCISGTISLTTIFVAYRLMPIADASTIHFSSPVFVTVFAYFMLKEPFTILQVITGAVTLTGVVIIAKPEFLFESESEEVHLHRMEGTVLAVVAAVTAGFSMINLRKLKTTPAAVVVMWYSATVIVSGLTILIIVNKLVWPTGLLTWLLLGAIGLCGIGDQFFLTVALQYESAGPVSVTRTFNIVLTFIWEVVLDLEEIEWSSVLGASLITSCVIILAMVKWRSESPHLFETLYNKMCCCFAAKSDNQVNGNLKKIPESLRASNESIDSMVVQSTVHSNAVLLKSDDEKA